MEGDEDYVAGRRTDRVYFSRQFTGASEGQTRPKRFIYRVLEAGGRVEQVEVHGEVVIRETPSGRQQIRALFYVDNNAVESLTLQRFSTESGRPHNGTHFSLRGEEIDRLLEIATLVKTTTFDNEDRVRIDVADLPVFRFTEQAALELARDHPGLIARIIEHEITDRDVVAIAYRKDRLKYFERLLGETGYFESEQQRLGLRPEALWQHFFEQNSWILGYGLFYVFTSSLDGRTLEQFVSGHSIARAGKKIDALLRTRGRLSSLCFVEVKTHRTRLLDSNEYRAECWPISRELTGAIAQVQRTVERAESEIGRKLQPLDKEGRNTGDAIHLIEPRSIIIAGDLNEFAHGDDVNDIKYTSFELFRRQVRAPEIITFDELYERAQFIVESSTISSIAPTA